MHEQCLNTWISARASYSSGLGMILHGSEGLGLGRSETLTNIVHYTFTDSGSDRDASTHRLAHEFGHILGLDDEYDKRAGAPTRLFEPGRHTATRKVVTPPTESWQTLSFAGAEGNLMADIVRDEPHRPPLLGPRQVQQMGRAAVEAARMGRFQCGQATYFGQPWSMRKMVRR